MRRISTQKCSSWRVLVDPEKVQTIRVLMVQADLLVSRGWSWESLFRLFVMSPRQQAGMWVRAPFPFRPDLHHLLLQDKVERRRILPHRTEISKLLHSYSQQYAGKSSRKRLNQSTQTCYCRNSAAILCPGLGQAVAMNPLLVIVYSPNSPLPRLTRVYPRTHSPQ